METKLHAMLSPSGAHRWMVCAGSAAMEDGAPDNGNEYSAEGLCAHAVAKMCFDEGKPATAYIGRRIDVGPHETYEFREDMAEPTQIYVDFVNSLPGEKFTEVRVPIDHITGEKDAQGTADAIAISDDQEELILADLKFGQGVYVNAEKNKQGMMYASGALRKIDVLGSIKRIRIFIHQPRISETPSEWDCSVEELREFERQCAERAKLAMLAYTHRLNWLPTSKTPSIEWLTPGEEQCKFCKVKATCIAAAKYVKDAVGSDFEDLAVGAAASAPTALVPESDVSLSLKMKAAGMIEDWLKAVRAEVERRLLASIPVPGYKLVQGRQGNRSWTDAAAAEDLLRKQFRLPLEDAFTMKLKSPTQIEALLEKEHPKRWVKCQELIGRSPGVASVAPESDGRPALSVKAVADDFDAAEAGSDLV